MSQFTLLKPKLIFNLITNNLIGYNQNTFLWPAAIRNPMYDGLASSGCRNRRSIIRNAILALSDKWLSLDSCPMDKQIIISQMRFIHHGWVNKWFGQVLMPCYWLEGWLLLKFIWVSLGLAPIKIIWVIMTSLHGNCFCNRPVSQMRAPSGGLSRTSMKLWQDYSSCYMFLNIKRNIF